MVFSQDFKKNENLKIECLKLHQTTTQLSEYKSSNKNPLPLSKKSSHTQYCLALLKPKYFTLNVYTCISRVAICTQHMKE